MKFSGGLKFLLIVFILGFLASVPFWGSRYLILLFFLIFFYIAIAQMWNLLAGYSGLICLGQQMFIGLGGYTLAVLSLYYGFPVWLSVLLGGAICTLFALLISIPIFRMRGMYFAVGTWMIAEALRVAFSSWEYVKYGMGLFIQPAYTLSFNTLYYSSFFLGVGSVLLIYFLLRSKLGLGLMAMRDNEEAAEGMGVKVFSLKLYSFLLGAFITGIGGGIYYLYNVFIRPPSAFGISWTIGLTFMVIIGGIGTIEGPIVGAIIFVLLRQWLAEYGAISLLILGAVAIVVILILPKGIMGTVQGKLGFELFSSRHR